VRTGSELGFFVAVLVFASGFVLTLAGFGITEYFRSGWSAGVKFFLAFGFCWSCLLAFLIIRVGLRYVFGAGRVSAYNTWGRLMWSEDLTGLKDVTFFSSRGQTAMTLFWPGRKRRLVLFDSLKGAVDAAIELDKSLTERSTD